MDFAHYLVFSNKYQFDSVYNLLNNGSLQYYKNGDKSDDYNIYDYIGKLQHKTVFKKNDI